jgi:hypothetical protein
MNQNQNQNDQEKPAEDLPDTTMTDAGDKEPGEDPDFDEEEPGAQPDDPDIQGEDGSGKPS